MLPYTCNNTRRRINQSICRAKPEKVIRGRKLNT